MRTALRVQAGVWNHQTSYRFIADNVRVDNLVYIISGYSAIPDCIGIDNKIRTMLALIEAARLVGADGTFYSALGQLDFEHLLEISIAGRVAATTRVCGRPLIAANENMLLEFWHGAKNQS